jgi:hypothetical protein
VSSLNVAGAMAPHACLGHLLSPSVVRAGPAVYGAFDGSWKPLLPIFEGPDLMKHRIVTEYLEYLYGE